MVVKMNRLFIIQYYWLCESLKKQILQWWNAGFTGKLIVNIDICSFMNFTVKTKSRTSNHDVTVIKVQIVKLLFSKYVVVTNQVQYVVVTN